jgi:hypothetical protein
MAKPTDVAVVVAALPGRYSAADGWCAADEVAFRLRALGFDATAQQIAATLGRMARGDHPWIEVREQWGTRAYRVTEPGRDGLHAALPAVGAHAPWLPVWRARSAS